MTQRDIPQDSMETMVSIAAAALIEDGMVIGLGSGSTAVQLTYALAQRIQKGCALWEPFLLPKRPRNLPYS